jgi:hypothetical protein
MKVIKFTCGCTSDLEIHSRCPIHPDAKILSVFHKNELLECLVILDKRVETYMRKFDEQD